jgi:hypothetical protein
MDKYDQLKKVIQAANPEIMEPKLGCKVQSLDNSKFPKADWTAIQLSKNHFGRGYDELCVSSPEFGVAGYDIKGFEILGRPIRLADVLSALQESNKETDLLNPPKRMHGGVLKVEGGMLYMRHGNPVKWNLKDDNLDHQSEETKQFLINLLVK